MVNDMATEIDTNDENEFLVEIEVEEDQPKELSAQPAEKTQKETQDDDRSKEMDGYSKRVQERIGQLTKAKHEAERAALEMQKRAEQAEAFANVAAEERQNAFNALEWGKNEYLAEKHAKLDAAERYATLSKRQAIENGDTDAQMEADAVLRNIMVERASLNGAKPVPQENFRFSQQAHQQYQPPPPPPEPEQNTSRADLQPPPVVDIKAEEWALRNPWFQKDPKMTALAMGIDEDLRQKGTVQIGSDAYWAELDRQIAQVSNALNGTAPRRSSPVAPSARSTSGSVKVKLTPNQQKYADAHNIPHELMAREIYKLGE